MVMLDGEVADPEVFAASGGQRGFPNCLVHAATAQIPDSTDGAQGDVNGISRVQERPFFVR